MSRLSDAEITANKARLQTRHLKPEQPLDVWIDSVDGYRGGPLEEWVDGLIAERDQQAAEISRLREALDRRCDKCGMSTGEMHHDANCEGCLANFHYAEANSLRSTLTQREAELAACRAELAEAKTALEIVATGICHEH